MNIAFFLCIYIICHTQKNHETLTVKCVGGGSTLKVSPRQPIAVSDISIYICLIDIIDIIPKQIQRTTEWEASGLV